MLKFINNNRILRELLRHCIMTVPPTAAFESFTSLKVQALCVRPQNPILLWFLWIHIDWLQDPLSSSTAVR
jgi:hypothetical protein